jgi:hypothetical protein
MARIDPQYRGYLKKAGRVLHGLGRPFSTKEAAITKLYLWRK